MRLSRTLECDGPRPPLRSTILLFYRVYSKMNQFEAAQKIVRDGSFETTDQEKLMLYALYKIGTMGQAPRDSPSAFNPVEIAKRRAWVDFSREYSQEEAQKVYAALVAKFQTRGASRS